MANTLTLTQEALDSIVIAAVKAAMAELGQNPGSPKEPAKTTAKAPRQTAKANRMVSKWETIEGLQVVTLQRHEYNHELMGPLRPHGKRRRPDAGRRRYCI